MTTPDDIDVTRLHGTWRLVRTIARDAQGREVAAPYGPEPMGRIVLSPNGRMMAVLCDGRQSLPEGTARAYASYCGNYRIEGGRLVTRVDGSDLPERLGGDEVREVEWRGDALVLRPPRRADGTQRELTWERDGPA